MKYNYSVKRINAQRRGIEFTLTLEEYLDKWGAHTPGVDANGVKWCLCRIKEPGPYSWANTYIGTAIDNAQDASRNLRLKSNQYDCEVNNIKYDSLAEASRALNISYDKFLYISRRPQPCTYKGTTYNIIKGKRSMKTSKTDKYS